MVAELRRQPQVLRRHTDHRHGASLVAERCALEPGSRRERRSAPWRVRQLPRRRDGDSDDRHVSSECRVLLAGARKQVRSAGRRPDRVDLRRAGANERGLPQRGRCVQSSDRPEQRSPGDKVLAPLVGEVVPLHAARRVGRDLLVELMPPASVRSYGLTHVALAVRDTVRSARF